MAKMSGCNVTNLNIGLNLLGMFYHMPHIIIIYDKTMRLDSLFYLLFKVMSILNESLSFFNADRFEEMIRNWQELACTSFRIKWVT